MFPIAARGACADLSRVSEDRVYCTPSWQVVTLHDCTYVPSLGAYINMSPYEAAEVGMSFLCSRNITY